MAIYEEINKIKSFALEEISKAPDLVRLEGLRVKYLGRKGELTRILRGLEKYPDKERKTVGALANEARVGLENEISKRQKYLSETEFAKMLEQERVDVTASLEKIPLGRLHLATFAIRRIIEIFKALGFYRVRYPEIDTDWYAFESLNMPKSHPARDEWETFFIESANSNPLRRVEGEASIVLTPHTTNGQVHEMEKGQLPIRMINIARCHRRQSDISHAPMFHQFDGLLIDKSASIGDLKGTLEYFVKQFFGPKRKVRLRPFHFRFTEPSFETDISCDICGGTGRLKNGQICRLCKEGWLELGGAGMVHPNVLRAGKVDPQKYSGFAFGWGVERVMMMKEGLNIPDIRILYENDLRFLEQF